MKKFKHKEFFIEKTKEYFRPLKSKWIWIIVIPLSIIFTIIEGMNK